MEWVVFVDDEVSNREYASGLLSQNDIQVTALCSGIELINFIRENNSSSPDLILLDMNMPGFDGFETLRTLRQHEGHNTRIPVIFMSDTKEPETVAKGLQAGAIDCIGKPFVPEILISRVKNALRTHEKIQHLELEAMTDVLTGFLNKSTSEDRIREACLTETGLLCLLDLDSFKLINDFLGHDMGDRVLIRFSDLLKNNLRSHDICGRIGGDEFLVFTKNMRSEKELKNFTQRINKDYLDMLKQILGDRLKFSCGISIGAADVPGHGREYEKLFHIADRALSMAKHKGKSQCVLLDNPNNVQNDMSGKLTLDSVTRIMEERNITPNAMWMGREAFINIYRYMNRYMERYHGTAYRVLLTINMHTDTIEQHERSEILAQFRIMMQHSLRNSDVMVEVSDSQIFLLLPQMHEADIDTVMNRLLKNWGESEYHSLVDITWEAGKVI